MLFFCIFAAMIPYKKHTLSNGLTVVANRDRISKLAAVNLLYKVGARDESPDRTVRAPDVSRHDGSTRL